MRTGQMRIIISPILLQLKPEEVGTGHMINYNYPQLPHATSIGNIIHHCPAKRRHQYRGAPSTPLLLWWHYTPYQTVKK